MDQVLSLCHCEAGAGEFVRRGACHVYVATVSLGSRGSEGEMNTNHHVGRGQWPINVDHGLFVSVLNGVY